MESKIVKIKYNGKEESVTMKKLTFGDMNAIQNKAAPIKFVGKTAQCEVNIPILKEESITRCLIDAPFTIDVPTIRNLDAELGEAIWKEVNTYNNILPEEEKKSESPGQSGTEPQTVSSGES